jgi:prepilin-type N-terminal cleavage/methylation domain-containing protein
MKRRTLRRLGRDDCGFTLVEMMIVTAVLVVIVGAVLSLLDTATRTERISQARDTAEVTLRGALTQMTKELRTAVSIDSHSTQSVLDMQTLISDSTGSVSQHRVVYQVVGMSPNATLQRIIDPTGTAPGPYSGSAVQLADKVVAPQAFCYQFDDTATPAPGVCNASSPASTLSTVRVSLSVSPVAFSNGSVTLATDVQLRNVPH